MRFEWDPNKAQSNLSKHGVSFEEAVSALCDPMAATSSDPDHSLSEDRFITFGTSGRGRLLVVMHTEQSDTLRIISARFANKSERKIYEES
jgi:hypothetical protein